MIIMMYTFTCTLYDIYIYIYIYIEVKVNIVCIYRRVLKADGEGGLCLNRRTSICKLKATIVHAVHNPSSI